MASPSARLDSSQRDRPEVGWDAALGPLIGYGGDSTIVVLLPEFNSLAGSTFDASRANGAHVDLFGGRGFVGSAVVSGLGKSSEAEGCFEYSRGKIDANGAPWSVALPAGRATGIPMQNLSDLHGADSAMLVSDIVKLTATTSDASDSVWKDAPYLIEGAAVFDLGGTNVVAASVTQIIPGPEHWARNWFVVGERSAVASPHGYTLAYQHPQGPRGPNATKASGLDPEDEVGVDAVVVMKSGSRPTMLLETHGNEVNGYAALGRLTPGRWIVVWDGPHEGGC